MNKRPLSFYLLAGFFGLFVDLGDQIPNPFFNDPSRTPDPLPNDIGASRRGPKRGANLARQFASVARRGQRSKKVIHSVAVRKKRQNVIQVDNRCILTTFGTFVTPA